ncbi:hypothetical protein [Bacillus sp. FJAT-29814]|uniref:hypothetical protein n=1 Tax=Bacillus sp. FJAT-29814 TaxID=1729688 RepID=UPI000831D6F1|nr:hypothetical protein [Bacillus sp. FJAT-29814]
MERKNKIDNKNEFDVTELAPVFLGLAFVSPFFGAFGNKVLGISFSELGTYGDLLGGSTLPFLTFASILYIIRTINIQKEQLNIQKDEISLVREELEDAKIALQEQSKTSRLNRFENIFYNLINEIRIDILGFSFHTESKTYSGYEYLKYLLVTFNKRMESGTNSPEFNKQVKNIRKEHFNEDFYKIYGKVVEDSYFSLERGTDFDVFQDHLQQVFLLLERNINLLDEWDLEFYLKYLFNLTRKETLILYLLSNAFLFNDKGINSIKKLNLLNYISKFDTGNTTDYKFIKFVVENDFEILPSFTFNEKDSAQGN